MRELVLKSRHAEAGAKWAPFAGFEMPVSYSGILAEHEAVRTSVGLFDVSHMGEVIVEGPKATEVVNTLVSHDLRTTRDGQARYAVMCNAQGGVVDDVLVYRISAERYWLCINAANVAKDVAHMKAHAPGGATLTNVSDAWCQFALQGPKSAEVLEPLVSGGASASALGYYTFREGVEVAGVRGCLVSRTGYTGEDGFEIYVPNEGAAQVWDALTRKGDGVEVVPCGLGCRDTLRMEAKFMLYGQDLSETINPYEAGLSWVVKLDKPEDFVGRAALEEIKAAGVTRRMRVFRLEGRGVPRRDYAIYDGDDEIGVLTSGTYSPSFKTGIGLGYVKRSASKLKEVEIELRRGKRVKSVMQREALYKR